MIIGGLAVAAGAGAEAGAETETEMSAVKIREGEIPGLALGPGKGVIRGGNAATAAAAARAEINTVKDPGVPGVTTDIPVRRDTEKSSHPVREENHHRQIGVSINQENHNLVPLKEHHHLR